MGDVEERIVSDMPNAGKEVSDHIDHRTADIQAEKGRNSGLMKSKLADSRTQENAQKIEIEEEEEKAQVAEEGYDGEIQAVKKRR